MGSRKVNSINMIIKPTPIAGEGLIYDMTTKKAETSVRKE